ncbi:hypothetical protein [Denitrobaculum tricleocarpae]|uniref:Uncharacterized protein n=1 Tax=Denitrobaculum tricleocarpae TaxID=2591009 RepID=A0A545TT15_9PROT|nr:hypothetical protein [Denitrobaculum tricleocarpae]TQV80358.1 hypothetical protein FKG95_09185 [Denitrobaculum tricleocarpae]
MSEQDTIWVGTFSDGSTATCCKGDCRENKRKGVEGQVCKYGAPRFYPHVPAAELEALKAREAKLQIAMTAIAEGLEKHLADYDCATNPFIRDDREVIADAATEARKALTEFERTER